MKKIVSVIFTVNRSIYNTSMKSNKTSALISIVVQHFWFKKSTTQAVPTLGLVRTGTETVTAWPAFVRKSLSDVWCNSSIVNTGYGRLH